WSYGEENYRIMRKYYDIRLSMHDYIKRLYDEASVSGYPLIRTMFFEFPDDPKCWELQDQYMFGSRYLVAPVLELHQREREVYLPAGRWKDLNSGRIEEGGRRVTAAAPVDVIPVYEKV
ncbi:MAG: family 31 glucosidase, partial [Clostridia bacterium]|nr:family 31 glucosidase [Clostridia bacterium]